MRLWHSLRIKVVGLSAIRPLCHYASVRACVLKDRVPTKPLWLLRLLETSVTAFTLCTHTVFSLLHVEPIDEEEICFARIFAYQRAAIGCVI